MSEAKRKRAKSAGSLSDPSFQKAVFTQAFEQTCKLLDNPQLADLRALILTYRGRDGALDKTAASYGTAGGAECQIGCSSCCHQMVLCTPFEVFSIGRYLLDTKVAAELDGIKARLEQLSRLPLDPAARYDARWPCALLENNRCTVYEKRPSVCRTMLSASRVACETCLISKSGTIPYVAGPSQIAVLMQLGIDHALITRRGLRTERVELSRALLTALNDFDGALASWGGGGNPFANGEIRSPGTPPNQEIVEMTAKRFKVR